MSDELSRFGTGIRGSWVWDHDKNCLVQRTKAPRVRVHAVHTDTVDAFEHPATGQMCDSRSQARRITKDHGFEEIGGPRGVKPRQHLSEEEEIRDDIEWAWNAVKYGDAPLTEEEREQCRREQERLNRRP